MTAYHDEEWGVPSRDDRHLFELLTLEGAQAGLSWSTILNKREGYRRAFAGFDAATVARFGPDGRRAAAPGPGHRPESAQGRIDHRERSARARGREAARLLRLVRVGVRRWHAARRRLAVARRASRRDRPLEGALEGSEEARLPVRRADRLLRVHAGGRPRERPHGGLLPVRRARADDHADPVRAERRRQHRVPGHGRGTRSTSCWSPGSSRTSRSTGSIPEARALRADRVVRAAHPLRQARHRPLRPRRRASRLRDAHGRRPRRDGRSGKRVGGALRLLGRRSDVRALRRHVSRSARARSSSTAPTRSDENPDDDYPWAPTEEERQRVAAGARGDVGREHRALDDGSQRRRCARGLVAAPRLGPG